MEGILPLWKPKGVTSHDCVFKVRKILQTKKVGHTGTLDPDVEGVLPLCIGRATKVAEYLTDAGKSYIGEVTIGFSTTTEDASGEVVDEQLVTQKIRVDEIKQTLDKLIGDITQIPPMYSAVKVNGKKLYEYARAGMEVTRPARQVTIYRLELIDEEIKYEHGLVSFRFKVDCSKGTYIRTLATTIGEMLGYPAHMSFLERTQSANFKKEDCITIEQLAQYMEDGEVEAHLFPLEHGIAHLPTRKIDEEMAEQVKNGKVFPLPEDWKQDEKVVFMYNNCAIAIYQTHPTKQGLIKPVKVLRNE